MEIKPRLRTVVLAYGCMLLLGAVVTIINSTLVPLATIYGTDVSSISLLISCLGIGRIITQLFCGSLADRVGRKYVSAAGLAMVLAYFSLMPVLRGFGAALVVSVVGGMGFGMVNTAMLALIFDCFAPIGRNSTAQCYVQLLYSLGGVITPFVTNRLLTYGVDWSYLYWGCAAYALLLFAATLLIRFPGRYRDEQYKSGFVRKPVLKREGLLICCSVFFIYSTGIISTTWVAAFAADTLGIGDTDAVLALAVYNIGCVIGTVFFAQLLKRVHGTILMITNACAAFVAFSVSMLAGSAPVFYISIFFAGFVVAVSFNIGVGIGGELFSDNAATIAAMISVTSALSTLLLPAGTGRILRAAGVRTVFAFVVLLSAAAIFVNVLLRRRYLSLKDPSVSGHK
ncbi:MAG: MFS transporter [Oscillospiraceae bacterium]|nr:MFS transporter [Oscillospiraceae bacterium]